MVGIIGKKVGMTQVFNEFGELIPVTVIEVKPNVVVDTRTDKRNGYQSLVLGVGDMKPKKVTKPYSGQFKEKVEPRKYLKEFRGFQSECSVGDNVGVEILDGLSYVDVAAFSKGKGFQGVMKRHGFHGGRKTHGSKFHRAGGSTGMAAFPARVFKGTKMAGRMGGVQRTAQNLQIVKVDVEQQVLLVKGSVPGVNNSIVIVKQAKKKS